MVVTSNTSKTLIEAVNRIASAMHPEKIYLFGSHAWGVPTVDSDIDLFVIVRESDQPAYKRSREAYRSLRGIREPLEVIVRTVMEVEKSKTVASSLIKKVLEQGKLLYG
jgi:predicted nucleotidyltransferase